MKNLNDSFSNDPKDRHRRTYKTPKIIGLNNITTGQGVCNPSGNTDIGNCDAGAFAAKNCINTGDFAGTKCNPVGGSGAT